MGSPPPAEWVVKREESGSVPIPRRADSCDLPFELELCATEPPYHCFGSSSLYGRFDSDLDSISKSMPEPFKMDDDDIFQVDKADLIQGPTLAELNANDDTLLDDLNFDDLLLPEESSFYLQIGDTMAQNVRYSTPSLQVHPPVAQQPSPIGFGLSNISCGDGTDTSSPMDMFTRHHGGAFSPGSGHSSQPSSLHSSQHGSPCLGLQELLTATTTKPGFPSISVGGPRHRHIAATRLSSSAPTHQNLEQIWQRREPRKHLLSTGSLAEAGSTSSLSTGGVLSPGAHEDLSHDEDSDDDSDRYEDFSSDNDSDGEDGNENKSHRKRVASKSERYFWQYNIQAKGPKGQRLVLKTKLEDPHVLNEVTDPVFSPSCSLRGIKHSGKARKGDGNDLTPNPKKLFIIGKELDNLSRIINDMTPVSELPFNVRPKTRKEKNKLASRACRLKKKAQHEANKLKLYGLQHEHKQLINGISQIKRMIANKFVDEPAGHTQINFQMEEVVQNATKIKIAGSSSEYVNKILDKIKSGVPDGGMNDF